MTACVGRLLFRECVRLGFMRQPSLPIRCTFQAWGGGEREDERKVQRVYSDDEEREEEQWTMGSQPPQWKNGGSAAVGLPLVACLTRGGETMVGKWRAGKEKQNSNESKK